MELRIARFSVPNRFQWEYGHRGGGDPIPCCHRMHQNYLTMNDVESYGIIGKEKKQTMLYQRIIAYLAILLVMLAFIFSCIGLNMGRQVASLRLRNA